MLRSAPLLLALLGSCCRATAPSPCHTLQLKYCNATAGKGAPCLACEKAHSDLAKICGSGKGSKFDRFCEPPGPPPKPGPPGPPPPPPPDTPDCPNGPDHACKEPATPRIAAGYPSSNLFWPGESDAEGRVYTCTYCPMVTLYNNTRLVALGGCTPVGCGGCNGIHVSDGLLRSGTGSGTDSGSSCGAACIKTSDDGGHSWSKIRKHQTHISAVARGRRVYLLRGMNVSPQIPQFT